MVDFADTMGDAWLEDAGVQTDEVAQTETADVAATETVEPEKVVEEAAAEEPVETAEEQAEKFSPTLYREMKEERRKRQELERQLQEVQARAPKPEPQRPDAYYDPDGFNNHFETALERQAWQIRADLSKERATEKHGDETVSKAVQWAQERAGVDPVFDGEIGRAKWPVEFVVNEYKRSQTLEALGGQDLDAYVKSKAEEYAKSQGWIVSPEGQAPSSLKPSQPTPPKSLATAPATGLKASPDAGWDDVSFALDRKWQK